MSYGPEENEHFTCPWSWCQCTHVGCVSGWIERTRDDGTEYAEPCPTCRPEVAQHLGDRRKPLHRLRRELPALPRPSRTRRPVEGAA
jgi:hypothetical protein